MTAKVCIGSDGEGKRMVTVDLEIVLPPSSCLSSANAHLRSRLFFSTLTHVRLLNIPTLRRGSRREREQRFCASRTKVSSTSSQCDVLPPPFPSFFQPFWPDVLADMFSHSPDRTPDLEVFTVGEKMEVPSRAASSFPLFALLFSPPSPPLG